MFRSSLDLLLKIQPTKLPAYKRQTLLVFSGNFRDHKFIIIFKLKLGVVAVKKPVVLDTTLQLFVQQVVS